MHHFAAAYALGFLLWTQDGSHPAILLLVLLAVTVWLALYLRHRRRMRPREYE